MLLPGGGKGDVEVVLLLPGGGRGDVEVVLGQGDVLDADDE